MPITQVSAQPVVGGLLGGVGLGSVNAPLSLPALDNLPVDPTSLLGGSLPALDAQPVDPTSPLDGALLLLPGLDDLPVNPALLVGGGGLPALPVVGDNPLQPFFNQVSGQAPL